MRHADPDDLAGMVLDRDQAPADVLEHVATCDECAALADALSVTMGLARADQPLVSPPDHVRRNVLDALVADAPRPVAPSESPAGQVTPIGRRRDRGMPWWVTALAAAAALVVGLGIGRTFVPQDDQPADEVLMAADLSELDGPQQLGSAQAVSTGASDVLTIRVRASDLEAQGLLEVWLINLDGRRMVSLGFLASGESGDFEVPARLMDEGYRLVDISAEPDDGDPTHSGVSLARGELA